MIAATACSSGDSSTLTIYSGRSEELVGPLVQQFEEESGIDVEVRYAGSTELAATILQEGDRSPADLFFAQDPASLGAVALDGLFSELPSNVLDAVAPGFSDSSGLWVGVSGRIRVVVFNTDRLTDSDLPTEVSGFTDPRWSSRIGIAPSNGSFLAFVAAMILTDGEESSLEWLKGIAANDPVKFPNNSSIVAAVAAGEVEAGLVNHYYLLRAIAEQGADEVPAANHFMGGPGGLVMPAGVGMLASTDSESGALEFIDFLHDSTAQAYFAQETFEYPLAAGVAAGDELPALDSLVQLDIDLSLLATALDRATDLVAEAGLL